MTYSLWKTDNFGEVSYFLVTTSLFFSFGFWLLAFCFLLWIFPIASRIFRSKITRSVAIIFHAFAVFLGAIPARNLISATMGLPPQDYDLAVSLIALFFYPLSWIFLAATVASIFYVLAGVSATALFILHQLLEVPKMIFSIFSMRLQQSIDKLNSRIDSVVEISLMHGAGAVILSLFLVSSLQIFTEFSHTSNRAVAILAYFTDYHYNSSYPIVRQGVQSKIHGNGVVSYAYPEDSWYLRFEVEEVQDSPTISGEYVLKSFSFPSDASQR